MNEWMQIKIMEGKIVLNIKIYEKSNKIKIR